MKTPVFISYYTRGTSYEEESAGMAASLAALGLEARIEGIAPLGSWQRNCLYKPTYILQCLLDARGPVVWIDADARVIRRPDLLLIDGTAEGVDAAFCVRNGEVLAGLLLFNYTEMTLAFLGRWVWRCSRVWSGDRCSHDMHHLNDLYLANDHRLHALVLPASYSLLPEDPQDGAVIAQRQASRRLSREAGYEAPPVPAPVSQLDPGRCAVCGWPMDSQGGCAPGDCSMRPRPERLYDAGRAAREGGGA